MKRVLRLARSSRKWLLPAGVALTVLLGAASAIAFFSAAGSGHAAATLGSLGAPAAPGATAGAGTVALTWSGVSPPSGGTVSYYVKRDGVDPGGNCPTQASPSTAESCTDSGLSSGTHDYTVTAVWRSWSATSDSTAVTLISGTLDHFALSAASTTPTAGAADNLTITAKDSAGNTVTTYSGDQTLTFSGAGTIGSHQPTVTSKTGTAVAFGTSETIAFTSGVAVVSGSGNGQMTLYKAESATITVSDGTHTGSTNVTVGTASANQLTFIQSPGSTSADDALSLQPQVTVLDQFGNTVAGDSSIVTLSIASGTPTSGGPGSVSGCSQSESNGVISFSGCRITTIGTGYKLHATDGTLTAADSTAFNITPGAVSATQSTLTPVSSSITANGTATQVLTVTAKDAYGNNLTSSGATVTITKQSGTGSIGSVTDNGNGTYTAIATAPTSTGSAVFVATLNSNPVKNGTGSQTQATVNYVPGPVTQLAVTTQPGGATAGSAFGQQPVVKTQDQYGNNSTVGLGANRNVTIAIASGTGTLQGTATLDIGTGAGNGTVTFTNLRIDQAGTKTLSATAAAGSPTLTGATSNSFTVSAGTATTLSIGSGSNQSASINTAFAGPLVANVTDNFGNPVAGVSVTFTAPGSGASGTFLASSGTCNNGGSAVASCGAITDSSGNATSSTYAANGTAGAYNVVASSSGLTNANFSLTNYGAWTWQANGTAQTWSSNTAQNVAYPSGTTSGDLLLLVVVQPTNASTAPTTPAGWTLLGGMKQGSNIRTTVFWRSAGVEVSVSVTPGSVPASAWVVRYERPGSFGPSAASAAAATTGGANSGTTFVAPAVTTTATNATVISIVGVTGANTLSLSTPQSFSLQAALTTSTPADAFGLGDRFVGSAGAVTAPTWRSTASTAWAAVTGAFK